MYEYKNKYNYTFGAKNKLNYSKTVVVNLSSYNQRVSEFRG